MRISPADTQRTLCGLRGAPVQEVSSLAVGLALSLRVAGIPHIQMSCLCTYLGIMEHKMVLLLPSLHKGLPSTPPSWL